MKKGIILWVLIIAAICLLGFGIYIVKELCSQNIMLNNHVKILENNIVSLDEAIRQYRETEDERAKTEGEALDYLRWKYMLKEQVDQARARLTAKAAEISNLKKDKNLAGLAYYNLGLSCVLASDFDAAINAFEEALKLDPKDAFSCYDLGLLYSAYRKDPEKAIKYYNRYLELAPKDAKAGEVREWIEILKNKGKIE